MRQARLTGRLIVKHLNDKAKPNHIDETRTVYMFAIITSNCSASPHQNELDSTKFHCEMKNSVCSLQFVCPRKSLQDMTCLWKLSGNHSLRRLASNLLHAILCAHSVLPSFCYLGKMRPRSGESHPRTHTGSRHPPLTPANQMHTRSNVFFLKPLSYGSCLSTSILTHKGS